MSETLCSLCGQPRHVFERQAIARENSVKQYDSEQRKLDAGQSDIYKVLERQTALTTARATNFAHRPS